jgi:serine protease inhibitor
MTKLIFFVFSFIMLTGCTNSNTSGANSLKNDTINVDNSKQIGISEVDSAFKLDFFNAIPDTLSGCGEYFTYDTTPVT